MVQGSTRGQPSSWIAVAVIIVGFIVGGVGVAAGPAWPVLIVGAVIIGVGVAFGLATGIMRDVH